MTAHGDPVTLSELLLRAAPTDPAATTLLEVPGGERLTYADARNLSGRLANALRAVGVGAGDRVAVQIEKSPLAVLLYLACIRAGAVFLPMNTAYTADEVAYLLGDAEPALCVRDPRRADDPHPPSVQVLTADDHGAGTLADLAAAQPAAFDDVAPAPDDTAAILYTSGTTGRPKGAMLTHHNLTANALALHRAWGFGPDDVLLHALPMFHAHGLFVATNCVLANGTGMVFLPRFDADAVVAELPRCTVFMGVPTFYGRLMAHPGFDADVCRRIRLFVSGSAPLLAATHDEFRARTGHAILERYGMTETTMLTSNPLVGERRPGTVGFPLPGVQVRVADSETGAPLAAGEVGGVEVAGPSVFRGYWRRPDLAASEFTVDGFFRTGDLGRFDADGYLHLVGRSKDLIISGGLNIYPPEVEKVLDGLDGILESAVIGLPDADFGEMVVAVVVADTEAPAPIDTETVRAAARLRLAPFKVPRRVEVVDALPRNTMGKVEKAKLRARFSPADA